MASTLTNLLYHIVFSTKHREPIIGPSIHDNLYAYIGGIIREDGGTLLQVGGMPDHVHIVARFRSDPSVAEMVKTFKAKSSKWMNERHGHEGHFGWQTGYGAFTVSQSQLASVIRYVRNQEKHHRRNSFQDEFRRLLEKNQIEYDERYLWD